MQILDNKSIRIRTCAKMFIYESGIVDDIRLLEYYYCASIYITYHVPECLLVYNDDFKSVLCTSINNSVTLLKFKDSMKRTIILSLKKQSLTTVWNVE